jgi:hypothetical protein
MFKLETKLAKIRFVSSVRSRTRIIANCINSVAGACLVGIAGSSRPRHLAQRSRTDVVRPVLIPEMRFRLRMKLKKPEGL